MKNKTDVMTNSVPTVLIFLLDMFSARNFLFTPLWEHLKSAGDLNFVIVSDSPSHGEFVKKENVSHIHWEMLGYLPGHKKSGLYTLLKRPLFSLFWKTVQSVIESICNRILHELYVRILFRFNHIKEFQTHRLKLRLPQQERFKEFGELEYLGRPFPKSKKLFYLLYRIYTASRWPSPRWLSSLFRKYAPDLIVIAYPQKGQGFQIVREVRRNNLPMIAYINSWDHPTTKGPLPDGFKQLMVWNRQMQQELIDYHDVSAEQISVVGAAHLDLYYNKDLIRSRDDFMKSLGVDPERRLIVFGTYSKRLGPDEPTIARYIAKKVEADAYVLPTTLYIRAYPKDRDWQERFGSLALLPNVVVRCASNFKDDGISDTAKYATNDLKLLVNLMNHADVVLTGPGTLAMDAVAFDTPVVSIGFDGDRNLPYERSILFRYDFDHYAKVTEIGGSRLVKSFDEMDRAINEYLENPNIDAAKRERLREQQLTPFDGCSGERIVTKIVMAAKKFYNENSLS